MSSVICQHNQFVFDINLTILDKTVGKLIRLVHQPKVERSTISDLIIDIV